MGAMIRLIGNDKPHRRLFVIAIVTNQTHGNIITLYDYAAQINAVQCLRMFHDLLLPRASLDLEWSLSQWLVGPKYDSEDLGIRAELFTPGIGDAIIKNGLWATARRSAALEELCRGAYLYEAASGVPWQPARTLARELAAAAAETAATAAATPLD
jgi:hypothetical protein